VSIDGAIGTNTLVLKAAATVNLANVDQTTGDAVNVTNFENLDASALSTGLAVTASAFANTITTGAGNDTIDGGGGTDVIVAGTGNDTVSYYGSETSLDGGTGTNTLLMKAASTVNLGNAGSQSGGDLSVDRDHASTLQNKTTCSPLPQ
jgi:Ca2+-binding RTX toxin-like protein